MSLRTATLIAIMGSLLSLLMQLFYLLGGQTFIQFLYGGPIRLGTLLSMVSTGCLLVFLFTLFSKQE